MSDKETQREREREQQVVGAAGLLLTSLPFLPPQSFRFFLLEEGDCCEPDCLFSSSSSSSHISYSSYLIRKKVAL